MNRKERLKRNRKVLNNMWCVVERVLLKPMACAMTGFGMFWWYRLFQINIWISLIFALYSSALMSSYK